jgi:Na+-transporting methylmalonyl-CoA/oxaloacetate decarboxylase gamma subunit
MKNIYLRLLPVFLLSLFISPVASAKIINIFPIADTRINEQSPTATQYNLKLLNVGDGDYERIWSLVKFDLSVIPSEAIINNASLSLYFSDIEGETHESNGAGCAASIRRVTENWVEGSTTWANKPGYENTGVSIFIVNAPNRYQSFNVKSIVERWHKYPTTTRNYGFYIVTRATEGYCSFPSREDVLSKWPKLVVDYTVLTPVIGPSVALNTDTAKVVTAATPPASFTLDTPALKISNLRIVGKTSTGVALAWDTNKSAGASVDYRLLNRVIWVTKTILGTSTAHSYKITGLVPSSTYAYRVRARTIAGESASSTILQFKTLAAGSTTTTTTTTTTTSASAGTTTVSTSEESTTTGAGNVENLSTDESCATTAGQNKLYITDVVVEPRSDGGVFQWTVLGCDTTNQLVETKASEFVYVDKDSDPQANYQSFDRNFGKNQLTWGIHEVEALSDLYFAPNKTYFYRIYSEDTNGRVGLSDLNAFTTAAVTSGEDTSVEEGTVSDDGTILTPENTTEAGVDENGTAVEPNSAVDNENIPEFEKQVNAVLGPIFDKVNGLPIFSVVAGSFIALFLGVGFFVLLLLILIIVLVRRKKKKAQKQVQTEAQVQTQAVVTETTNTISTEPVKPVTPETADKPKA